MGTDSHCHLKAAGSAFQIMLTCIMNDSDDVMHNKHKRWMNPTYWSTQGSVWKEAAASPQSDVGKWFSWGPKDCKGTLDGGFFFSSLSLLLFEKLKTLPR